MFSVACAAQTAADPHVDTRELMKRSIEAGDRNGIRVREYASRSRIEEKQLNADGTVRSEETKTYDAELIDGVRVRRLIAKNDRPLSADEAAKEQTRISRFVASKKQETAAQKSKRLEAREKNREKQKEFNHEILDAFDFRLAGEEMIDGRKNWILEATPHAGYKPKEMQTQMLAHMKGKVWIDQQDNQWTKVDAVATDAVSMGFGLVAKLDQGAHFSFQQMRLDDGVWVMRESGMRAVIHVALVKRISIDQLSKFENYRKMPVSVEADDSKKN
jgi:hypothetical protein